MKEALKIFVQMNLTGIPSVIFSQVLGHGAMPCGLQDGQTTGQYGQDHVRANLTARQAKEKDLLTSGTYGQAGYISSSSRSLQRSLESNLQARLPLIGSILYKMTWKVRVTPLGLQICQLQARAHRISGKDSISALPTPTARDHRGRIGMDNLERRKHHPRGVPLPELMQREAGRPGYLNPELPRLLMGLPEEWDEHAPTETVSSLKSRKRS